MHNAFTKGLQAHGQIISDVITKIFYFFDGLPTRNEQYETVQKQMGVPLHAFIKRTFAMADSAASGRENN